MRWAGGGGGGGGGGAYSQLAACVIAARNYKSPCIVVMLNVNYNMRAVRVCLRPLSLLNIYLSDCLACLVAE